MVALNKTDGSLVWKTKSLGGAKAYASPVLINHNGKDMVLAQTSENIIGINPLNGEILWSYNLIQYHERSQGKGAQTNPPIYTMAKFLSPAAMIIREYCFHLHDDGKSVRLKWKNETIDTHHGGVVLVDGNLYGSNWQNNAKGRWTSVNWETGKTNWEQDWHNKGSIIYADGMLYLYEEKSGNVALVKPDAEKLNIISTFKIEDGAGPHWAHPAIYDGRLFIRHGDALMVYDVTEK